MVGSNIFNMLGGLGLATLVSPQSVSAQILAVDTPVMLFASLALLPLVKSGGRITRGEGAVLLAGCGAHVYAIGTISG